MAWQSVDEIAEAIREAEWHADMPLGFTLSDEAVAQFPESSKAWAMYARYLPWRGRKEEASAAVDKSLQLDPQCAWAWTAKASVDSFFGITDRAAEAAHHALALDDTLPFVLAHCAVAISIGGDNDTALRLISRWRELYPDDIEAIGYMITHLTVAGRPNDALQALAEAEAKYPDEPLFWRLKAQRLVRSDTETAAAMLKKCTEVTPGSYMSWTMLAMAYFYSNRFEESEAAALRAIEITPCSTVAAKTLAQLCERRGEKRKAEEWRKQQTEAIPALAAMEFASTAQTAVNRRQYRKALKLVEAGVASPSLLTRQSALRIKASALVRMGRLRQAEAALDELDATGYDDPLAIQTRAEIALGLRQYDKAVQILRTGIERHPRSGNLRAKLFNLLVRKGEKEEADALAFYIARNLPLDPAGLRDIAASLMAGGYHLEAMKACRLGQEKYPNSPEFRYMESVMKTGGIRPTSFPRFIVWSGRMIINWWLKRLPGNWK